jgi:CTP synthase
MRLGAYRAKLDGNSVVHSIYGAAEISERHRHRYEVNVHYKGALEAGGLVFSGMSPDGALPEIVERPDHPWFVGVQFHPELKSKAVRPAPALRQLHRSGGEAEPAGLMLPLSRRLTDAGSASLGSP